MTESLPYDFDLHHDIKTLEELQREYTWAVEKIASIESLCEHHNIILEKPTPDDDHEDFQPFDHEHAKVMSTGRIRPGKPVEIKVIGNRDQRGPDNSVMIWVDDNDKLHIRIWKADRCYQFDEAYVTQGYVEVVAS